MAAWTPAELCPSGCQLGLMTSACALHPRGHLVLLVPLGGSGWDEGPEASSRQLPVCGCLCGLFPSPAASLSQALLRGSEPHCVAGSAGRGCLRDSWTSGVGGEWAACGVGWRPASWLRHPSLRTLRPAAWEGSGIAREPGRLGPAGTSEGLSQRKPKRLCPSLLFLVPKASNPSSSKCLRSPPTPGGEAVS